MKLNSYIIIVTIIYLLVFKTLKLSLKAPRKIKFVGITVSILAIIRYSVLLLLYMAGNIASLYILKPFVFLQILFVPMMVYCTINIVLKKSRFNHMYSALILLIILYFILIMKAPVSIEYIQGKGYVMEFCYGYIINWLFFAFNTFIFLLTLILIKTNVFLIRIAAFVSMVELIMIIFGMPFYIFPVLGELFWLIGFLWNLNKLKKQA